MLCKQKFSDLRQIAKKNKSFGELKAAYNDSSYFASPLPSQESILGIAILLCVAAFVARYSLAPVAFNILATLALVVPTLALLGLLTSLYLDKLDTSVKIAVKKIYEHFPTSIIRALPKGRILVIDPITARIEKTLNLEEVKNISHTTYFQGLGWRYEWIVRQNIEWQRREEARKRATELVAALHKTYPNCEFRPLPKDRFLITQHGTKRILHTIDLVAIEKILAANGLNVRWSPRDQDIAKNLRSVSRGRP